MKNKREKRKAIFLIGNLLLSLVAFSFLIGLTEVNAGPLQAFEETGGFNDIGGLQESAAPASAPQATGGGFNWLWGKTGGEGSPLSLKFLGTKASLPGGAILSNLFTAGLIAGGIYMVSNLLGASPDASKAFSLGAASAFLSYKAINYLFPALSKNALLGGFFPLSYSGLAAGIIGLAVVELFYKETSQKIVSFECLPWEAPVGGKDCQKCNSDLLPCSEYRCKSLGQACQLLNKGTNNEKCAWVNPKDVNAPIISLWTGVLTKDYKYVPFNAQNPADRGFKIQTSNGGCIKAFTPISFGITTKDEPSQCKIDYNRTSKMEQMAFYFGGSNIYDYNHSQTLSLPGPNAINAESPEIKNDGNYNLYIRCRDANGNENTGFFVFNFCVEKGPDVTPAVIEGTSIANNMPVQFNLNQTSLDVYVNEPADCKWSRTNMIGSSKDIYDKMEGTMACNQHVWEMNNQMLYKCSTTLNGLQNGKDNDFYFKCRDLPVLKDSNDRNINTDNYKFTIKGSANPLVISSIEPNGTIQGAGNLAIIYLELETEYGSNNGDAFCSYSITDKEKDYIEFYETGTNIHKQRMDLPAGEHVYYFQCVDLGGNSAKGKTSFKIEIDKGFPVVTRAYNEAGKLKIITDEKSTCSYSNNDERKCSFLVDEGVNMPYVNSTEHFAEWKPASYYIKCSDMQGNNPLPTECSIIVKPES